jgi:HEAT repeat protein
MHAVDALELIGGEIAFQALMQAQSDEDPDVADAVDESLSLLGTQK